MHSDDQIPSQHTSTEDHMPSEVILELLSGQIRHSIAPYRVEINARDIQDWCEGSMLLNFQTHNLIREIKNWSAHLQRRPVQCVNFVEPFLLLDAAELTELSQAIVQNLKVSDIRAIQHTATLSAEQVTRRNIALLQGLHFNHIRIQVSQFCTLEKLKACREIVDEFQIPQFSLVLEQEGTKQEMLFDLMEYLTFIKPDTITIAHARQFFDKADTINIPIAQFGYGFIPPTTIAKVPRKQQPVVEDFLRLGPGAHCQFGSIKTVNFRQVSTYVNIVNSTALPIAYCR